MAKKIKQVEYLQLSAYVRAKEVKLLNRERVERMIEAKTNEDALKVLEECGWGELPQADPACLEARFNTRLRDVFEDFRGMVPDERIMAALRLKYDYHNAKVLIKSEAIGTQSERLLSQLGNTELSVLTAAFMQKDFLHLPERLAKSIVEARDVLAKTGDPQLADFLLDRDYCEAFLELAKVSGSTFLEGYIRLYIDCVNLRAFIRSARAGKSIDLLQRAVIEGGSVPTRELLAAFGSDDKLQRLYSSTALAATAEEGVRALHGEKLTVFERLCDNALNRYLADAHLVGFGDAPFIAYILAAEAEVSTLRIIFAGRFAGSAANTIRERLREVV